MPTFDSTCVINLRSDTQTLPTRAMMEAMCNAPLGDDTYGEDPTVQKLESLSAELFGKEAGLFVLSGSMGNLICLMAQTSPGDEVILDADSHLFYYESGGLASVAGLMPMAVASDRGWIDPGDLRKSIRARDIHFPAPRLLSLENTHNRGGGRVIPIVLHQALCQVAREHGLAIHLDGARIFNASIAARTSVKEYASTVDTVMFCLTKGLSCPMGSVVVGSSELIHRARHVRKRLGGGMRQAGVVAAAGIVALNEMVDRLADDHVHAKLLAEGISLIPGLHVDVSTVETNMVYAYHTATGIETAQVLQRLRHCGVIADGRPPDQIRFVTNRHHDSAAIEEALRRIRTAVAGAR